MRTYLVLPLKTGPLRLPVDLAAADLDTEVAQAAALSALLGGSSDALATSQSRALAALHESAMGDASARPQRRAS